MRVGESAWRKAAGLVLNEISGVASPDGSLNGEIVISAIPEPSTLAFAVIGAVSLLLFRRDLQSGG
jgi:hypothetical protein